MPKDRLPENLDNYEEERKEDEKSAKKFADYIRRMEERLDTFKYESTLESALNFAGQVAFDDFTRAKSEKSLNYLATRGIRIEAIKNRNLPEAIDAIKANLMNTLLHAHPGPDLDEITLRHLVKIKLIKEEMARLGKEPRN